MAFCCCELVSPRCRLWRPRCGDCGNRMELVAGAGSLMAAAAFGSRAILTLKHEKPPSCKGGWEVCFFGWDGGIQRLPAAAALRCGALRLACYAGKRLRVSSAPHSRGIEPSACLHENALGCEGWSSALFLWLGRRDSNPQQPAPKTGVLPLNYVPICLPRVCSLSSLPKAREHRKRRRGDAPRGSVRRWR